MKTIISLILILNCAVLAKGQVSSLTRIKLLKEDSTRLGVGNDTSYIYNALILTHNIGGISSFTLICKTFDKQNATWIMSKDTNYTWNTVSALKHNNMDYKICKLNTNTLKLCLGRLDPATRQKFIFRITGSNGILIKEFNF